jgi:DNA-binding transcriptional regulator YiaG
MRTDDEHCRLSGNFSVDRRLQGNEGENMTLREWLHTTGTAVPAFAKQVGRHRTTVYAWVAGRKAPSIAAMAAVQKATANAVTPNDWVPAQ